MRDNIIYFAWLVVGGSVVTFVGCLEGDPSPSVPLYIVWIALTVIFSALIMTAEDVIEENKKLKDRLLMEQLSFYEPVNRPKQTVKELDALNTYVRREKEHHEIH